MTTLITSDKMKSIAPLFDGWDETLIWSCLQGIMGRAWADGTGAPKAAQIITGDFCYFAGNADTPKAVELVRNIPDDFTRKCIIMTPGSESWHSLIEDAYKGRFVRYTRYAIKKEPNVFNKANLRRYAETLPDGYTVVPICEELYNQTRAEEWSGDFCSQFPTFAEYQKHGLGYAVLHEGKLVCGASSYIYYDGGIEIEIGTLRAHRRRGLATACAANLILACLDRGMYPSWDAANPESVALAEKLGYHFDSEYLTYDITVS